MYTNYGIVYTDSTGEIQIGSILAKSPSHLEERFKVKYPECVLKHKEKPMLSLYE